MCEGAESHPRITAKGEVDSMYYTVDDVCRMTDNDEARVRSAIRHILRPKQVRRGELLLTVADVQRLQVELERIKIKKGAKNG